jgi:glutamate-5-semialdehyde dehydrogenase
MLKVKTKKSTLKLGSIIGVVVMDLQQVNQASRWLKYQGSAFKNRVLEQVAIELERSRQEILAANQKDLEIADKRGLVSSVRDRLLLTDERLESIIQSVTEVVALEDPVGKTVRQYQRPNGLTVLQQRVPLGVIFMIYESRPNVTIDAASLCFKSGNAVLLRGGSESVYTNRALLTVWQKVLSDYPEIFHAVAMVPDQSHETVAHLLKQDQWIDLVIPRGGESLIKAVVEQSRIPVLKHYKGVCHCYIDETADINLALNVIYDGKLSRPGVCNALETLLIHSKVSADFWQQLEKMARRERLELRACEQSIGKLPSAKLASAQDFGKEFLDKIVAVRQVSDVEEAISHIEQYGSRHTEVVVASNQQIVSRFRDGVDASVIMENCSSRFSDGGELGLGCEIGISTTKLHAYGPMGMESLTIPRYVVKGQGQVRHNPYTD